MSKEKEMLNQVLQRLKEIEQVKNDSDLALPLVTNKRNIAAWKERGALPPQSTLLAYCEKKKISLEWLLYGRGPIYISGLIAESGAIYRVETDQDAVYTLASDVYRALIELEQVITTEKFAEVVRLLHRDMLESRSQSLAYEKILGMVKLVGQ